MNILALDLGTRTGYAYNNGNHFECGTWILGSPKELAAQKKARFDRRTDVRVVELWSRLRHDFLKCAIDYVVFEDVQFSSSTMQTQLWASFRTTVWLAARLGTGNVIPVECAPTGTLKKFAGHGGANKEAMARFLCQRDNRFCRIGSANPKFFFRKSEEQLQEIDDNAIDAVWVWKWAQRNLGRLNNVSV